MCEGLPNAVCEAMCCECIPIGTKVPGIESAIGDTGFFVDFGNVNELVKTIKNAMNLTSDLGKKARDRIKKNFSISKRKEKLNKLLLELLENND